MSDVSGKVIMITGGSDGLGLELAVGFAAAGASISICGRTASTLGAARERIEAHGAVCVAHCADVADDSAVARWVAATLERLEVIDVLVNNASLLGPRVPLSEYGLEAWRRVIDVNLTGTFVVTSAVLPGMLARGRGSVINVSSGAAAAPRVNWGAYAVSKLALEGYSQNLAAELADTGVRINVVDPGAMRTRMRAAAYPEEDPAVLLRPAAHLPLFLWLASDESASETGRRFAASGWTGPD